MAGQWGLPPVQVGNGSLITNGQLVPAPMSGAFYPSAGFAPFYKGNGQGPPTVPVSFMGQSSGSTAMASNAVSNPLNFAVSPTVMALLALIIGLLGLRYIHWR